jgi:hypothetical protein
MTPDIYLWIPVPPIGVEDRLHGNDVGSDLGEHLTLPQANRLLKRTGKEKVLDN